MLFSNETIVALYKEACVNGDPVQQIKSLAKSNGVKATVIKKILIDAGCEVPDKIPTGPMKKVEPEEPAPEKEHKKAAVINEDFEAAVQDMIKESGCHKDKVSSCEGCDETDLCYNAEKLPAPVVKYLTYTMEGLRAEVEGLKKEAAAKEKELEVIKDFLGR